MAGGNTFRSINFDILIKSIFLLNERFTNCMTTKLEQGRMPTNLMCIRFQSNTLRTIPFSRTKLIATIRFITTFP